MEAPIRSTTYQTTNKIALGKADIPIIRSKLERPSYPSSTTSRRSEPELNKPSSVKTSLVPAQNIIVDPDTNPQRTATQIKNNPKNQPAKSAAISELSRRTANLQIQTPNSSTIFTDLIRSPRQEQEVLEGGSKIYRCVSPLPDSILKRIKTNEYEPITNPCKPGLYRFFM